MSKLLIVVAILGLHAAAFAGEADVLRVEVSCSTDSVCSFSVTVKHDDDGWEHYANKWEVLSPEGETIAVRELTHPHDDEQPFTRSLDNVAIPEGVVEVRVRAHDSVHAYGGKEVTVRLPD
ncbi:hypothetical protein MYX65_11010 [Acidobacteria bacterium AH-259-L09]|nr:hypothetical protein [Acidobacteria bacterium AH-259-L09]